MLLDIDSYGYDDDEAFAGFSGKNRRRPRSGIDLFKEPVHHLARLQFAVRDETLAEAMHRLEGIHKLKK